jgi:hypothetical protein
VIRAGRANAVSWGGGAWAGTYDEKDTCFYFALTMLCDLRVQADGFLLLILLNVHVCLCGGRRKDQSIASS